MRALTKIFLATVVLELWISRGIYAAEPCFDVHRDDDRQIDAIEKEFANWKPNLPSIECAHLLSPATTIFKGRISEFLRDEWKRQMKSDHEAMRGFLQALAGSGFGNGQRNCANGAPRSQLRVPVQGKISKPPRQSPRGGPLAILIATREIDYYCKEGWGEIESKGAAAVTELDRRIREGKIISEKLQKTENEFRAIREKITVCKGSNPKLDPGAAEIRLLRKRVDNLTDSLAKRKNPIQISITNASTQRAVCQSIPK